MTLWVAHKKMLLKLEGRQVLKEKKIARSRGHEFVLALLMIFFQTL